MSKSLKLFLGISYIVILFLFLYLIFSYVEVTRLDDFSYYKELQSNLEKTIGKNLYTNLFIFFFFCLIWVSLLGFGSPLLLISGILFGKWIGTFISVLSISIGALILYSITSFFFKDLVHQKLENKMVFLKELFKKNEFLYFLTYRFIGGIPFFIANTIPAIFNVKLKNYFFGTFLGMMPQLFVIVSLGSGLEKIIDENSSPPSFLEMVLSKDIYIPLIAFIILIFISLILKKLFYGKKSGALDENLTHD